MKFDIKDKKLATHGRNRIEWAERNMPVLRAIRSRFSKDKPLKGVKISACLHVTTETANLITTLKSGGADVALCASNPLSTQDDVAASLVIHSSIPVYAICGEDHRTYYRHIDEALNIKPHITMDDGADLVTTVHTKRKSDAGNILGGTEETTTGVIRLRSMEKKKILLYPIIAVNDAQTKFLFDNRYGTGQSTIDGILRATNILLAGSNFVVCGYGWCGRGVAMRAKGMGAKVIICEVDPWRGLEAVMDGFEVMPLRKAAKLGDVFVTTTGDVNVLRAEHFPRLKDGAILANSGHFNVEIDIPSLRKFSRKSRLIRKNVEEFLLKNGKRVYLLGEGRLINLASAEGHPARVMDMSFANQALCVEFMKKNAKKLEKKVYAVPKDIDRNIAILKLKSMGIEIDALTSQQKNYLSSWELGT
jgi:adenosylhomocysteinase